MYSKYEYYPKTYYDAMTFKEIDELSMQNVKLTRENCTKELMCIQDRKFYRYENFDRWKHEITERALIELNDLNERINYFKSEYDRLPSINLCESDSIKFSENYNQTLTTYNYAKCDYDEMKKMTISDLRKCLGDHIPNCCKYLSIYIKLGHDWCNFLIGSLRDCRVNVYNCEISNEFDIKSISLKKTD